MEKILIIDDSLIVQGMLSEILGEMYRLTIHGDPVRGLEEARANPPDLILLDVRMPVMDGFDLCMKLKEDEITRPIPVIFITSLDAESDRVRGFEAGGDDYVVKPFFPKELLARVKAHLGARRAKLQELEMARLNVFRELAVAVSHEINNPLTTVHAYIHMLQKELTDSDAPVREMLAHMHHESRRIGNIVRKIAEASVVKTTVYNRDIKMIDLHC